MDDGATSWIRRTKFSHTVCHRLDSSRLVSVPFTIDSNRTSSIKSRPQPNTTSPKPEKIVAQIQRHPITNRHRAISPSPQSKLSDTFKEARSSSKRFSTPHPQRNGKEKQNVGKLFLKDSRETKGTTSKSPLNTSPLRHFTSMKFHDKSKSRKESAWTKYFDHGGGRVISVETADEEMIDLSKLFVGLKFAKGAHSKVHHGKYMDKPVAVKITRVPDVDENGELGARLEKQFIREITLLSRLHHQNVLKFIAAYREPSVFCIVTEYLSMGSLRTYLHQLEHKILPLPKLISMALDIARGMEFVHSQGVIHRDLKPENLLISEDFCLKVADFGIACQESNCDRLTDDPGTYRWMAPEMIKKKQYGRKVDVYGFGLILWELVAGTIPYQDMDPIPAAFAVVNKNLRPTIPMDCPPAMKALIEQCWSLQPDKRPEFWQIVKILEEFDSSLARDGTLSLVQNLICQDYKKGMVQWIQKLGAHHQTTSSMLQPKFS